MNEWQQQVIDEHAQLDARMKKLDAFTNSPDFQKLTVEERMDLSFQVGHMYNYRKILARRIGRFT